MVVILEPLENQSVARALLKTCVILKTKLVTSTTDKKFKDTNEIFTHHGTYS